MRSRHICSPRSLGLVLLEREGATLYVTVKP